MDTDEAAMLLRRQLRALEAAAEYLGPRYPARRLQVLFYIAEHEPVTYKRLWMGVDSEDGTVRRDIDALAGDQHGPALVIERPDDGSGYGVTLWVSQRGREAVERIGLVTDGGA